MCGGNMIKWLHIRLEFAPRHCSYDTLLPPRPEGRKSCLVFSSKNRPLPPTFSPFFVHPTFHRNIQYIYVLYIEAIARCCVQCNYENLRVFCFNRQSALFSPLSRLLYFGENNLRSAKVFSRLNAEKHHWIKLGTNRKASFRFAFRKVTH